MLEKNPELMAEIENKIKESISSNDALLTADDEKGDEE